MEFKPGILEIFDLSDLARQDAIQFVPRDKFSFFGRHSFVSLQLRGRVVVCNEIARRKDANHQGFPDLGRLLQEPLIVRYEVPTAVLCALDEVKRVFRMFRRLGFTLNQSADPLVGRDLSPDFEVSLELD